MTWRGSAILVLDVAYKKDIGNLRESPALDIIHLLQEKGARVAYHDPQDAMVKEFASELLRDAFMAQADFAPGDYSFRDFS
ncbi:MAG: UDP binding domain-containing protein [Chloroflexota bacterium]|nr:UDP binding domain-containing protein [Chloroflexota bacterium]